MMRCHGQGIAVPDAPNFRDATGAKHDTRAWAALRPDRIFRDATRADLRLAVVPIPRAGIFVT